ncbi:hypothetical protein D3C73_1273010 [compost metagenome]
MKDADTLTPGRNGLSAVHAPITSHHDINSAPLDNLPQRLKRPAYNVGLVMGRDNDSTLGMGPGHGIAAVVVRVAWGKASQRR